MENKKNPIPPSARDQRLGGKPMRLPFERRRRKGGWADWIYRHRIGVMVTVVIYLSLAILFLTYRIIIEPAPLPSIEVEFTPEQMQKIEQVLEQQQQIEQMQAMSGKMQNKTSDENSKSSQSSRDYKLPSSSNVYDEAKQVTDRVNAGRESYNRSLSEIENQSKHKPNERSDNSQNNNKKSGGENRDAFVKGNVAASWNLSGRTADYIDIPAYKCEGGGQVVVLIAVNQNGRVVSASVERATSTSERCIIDEAIASAKASRFSASATAPNPQHGTITYTFVPQ